MANRLLGVLAIASIVCVPGAAAQEVNGTLLGTVEDSQGGALAGAVVRVSSPALIGRELNSTTNERGQLRFPALPPGRYALEIEVDGFRRYHEEGIRIDVGATVARRVRLDVAGVQETVIVSEAGSHVVARVNGFETRFGSDDLNGIPVRRFSMFDFVRAAPGVSPTSPGSMTTNSVSVFGSGINENAFLIDGTNFTCPCSGEARSEPGYDFIEQVQVQAIGASAEFGNIQGGVINVVTRQGSDRFTSDTSYYAQPGGLASHPVLLGIPGAAGRTSGYEREKYLDATTDAGGPLWRNHAWFFAGYQHLRDYDSQPGTDPLFPRRYQQDKVFGKLTWRLASRWQLLQSFHDEFWVNPELPTVVKPYEATQRRHATVPAMTFGHLTHTVTPNTVWDVRVGRFTYDRKDDPSTGDVTIPSHVDRLTNLLSGAPQTFGGLKLIRNTVKGSLDHYRASLFGAGHEIRIGGQIERGEHQLSTIIPGGVRYIDDSGRPYQAASAPPSLTGGVFVTAAAFASDALSIRERLTVNAGVRLDHSRAISQDLPQLDLQGRKTPSIVRGLGTLYTWNVWSPRLGATFNLSRDGRTTLRASYGRFDQGVLTGELSPVHPGATATTTTAWNATDGAYTIPVSVVDPRRNLLLDSHTRPPHTDEYSVGFDRELGRPLSLAIAYVRKTGADFIGWTDIGGQYAEQTRVLSNGESIPVFVLLNGTANRRFLLTNPDGYSLRYDALVIAAEKRRSHGWQAFASYTLSRASGLQVSSGGVASAAQTSTISGTPYLTFGQDPNSRTNAAGRLPNDRPNMLRAMGSVDVPRIGIAIAASAQYFTGKPWAAAAQIALPQGDTRILLESRGARRLPSQALVDVRVSRPLSFGRSARAELLVDILNALDEAAAEGLASENLFAANFAQPSQFVDPRRVMFGVRLSLGR